MSENNANVKMYPVDGAERERIEKVFTYHAPKADQPARYVHLREKAKSMAVDILQICPPSRERSLALTKLEEAIMHANASIARNE